MQNKGTLLKGMAAGALLMYVFDPSRRQRRAELRERSKDVARQAKDTGKRVGQDLARSMHGDGAAKSWPPALRLAASAGATYLAARSLRRGGTLGMGLGALGVGILARALTNKPVRQLVRRGDGIGDARYTTHFTKMLDINVPVAQMFEFWNDPENLPSFMSRIRAVKNLGNGRSHWVADGPAHIPVEWDAEITDCVPNEKIGWRSVAGSDVDHAGTVRFTPNGRGGTRVSVRMSYAPPAGKVGKAAAQLLHADPETLLDEDMSRLKTLIENRTSTTAGAASMAERRRAPDSPQAGAGVPRSTPGVREGRSASPMADPQSRPSRQPGRDPGEHPTI